ncbi:MAG: tetratricopeptide repeat protein, partial [Nitrospirota bacterium]
NRFRIFIGAMVFAALLFLIASVITNHRYFRKFDNVPYPEGAVKFIKDKEIKGNMFNLHGWGGYIVWELFPPVRTYIDNRFFYRKFFDEYEKILSGEMEWQYLLNRYKINIVLLNYSPAEDINLRDHLFRSSEWRLVYWDDYSLLYLKNEAGFKDINDEYSVRIVNPDTYRFRPYGLERTILMSASEEVRRNIKNAEDSWTARFILGNIMYSLGDAGDAIANFKDALRLSPGQSPAIYFNLGQAYMAAGSLQGAEESFKKVIKLEPVEEAYQALRRVYLMQGKNKEAEVISKKYLREK